LEFVTGSNPRGGSGDSRRWYRWVLRALVAYVIAMVISTHTPIERDLLPDADWPGADKLAHLGIFAGLSFLCALVLALRNASRGLRDGLSSTQYAWIAAGIAIYAALDELTQPWTGRDRSFWDWIADLAGMGLGLALFAASQRYRQRRRKLAAGPAD
jgi:VanZ family protein